MTLTLPPASLELSSMANLLCSEMATAVDAAAVPHLLTALSRGAFLLLLLGAASPGRLK